MSMSAYQKSLLFAASIIFTAQAQNTTNTTSTPEACFSRVAWLNSGNSSANSTGQRQFRWATDKESIPNDDPWYLSVLINDTVRRGDGPTSASNGGIELSGYLSVPDSVTNETSICTYMFSSVNATLDDASGDGEDSCEGIMSDDCMEFIKKNFREQKQGGRKCPSFRKPGTSGLEELKQKCPNLDAATYSTSFEDPSNTTCAYNTVPGVDIPDGYHSLGMPSISNPYTELGYHSNKTETYDLLVRQTIPYILYGEFQDPKTNSFAPLTRFVCLTPNRTLEGSRAVPEGKAPWENHGKRMLASRMTVVVAIMLGVLLAL